jgi:hypothetical protein
MRWPLLAAGGALLVPLSVLLRGYSLVWRDTAQLMGPLRPAVVAALRELRIPGWNPWEGTGTPLFSQFLNGVLHPVSILLAPFTGSVDALIVALVATAASGAWIAARTLGASPVAALGAAFTFGLSGFVLGMAGNTQYLMSAATGPWAVAGLVHASGPSRGWAAGAASVAALALAGDPGALAAFSLAGAVLALRAGGRGSVGPVALSCLAGLGLAAVQLAPAAVHLADTARGHGLLQPDDVRRWALAPWRLLELVAPGFLVGRPTSYVAPVFAALDGATPDRFPFVPSVFVGGATLALAAAGAARTAWARWLAGLALLFLWFSLGHRAGSQQLLSWVPIWGVLRYWEKMVAPLTLCLALAAAAGIDALAEGGGRPLGRGSLLGLCAALVALGVVALPSSEAFLFPRVEAAGLARTRLLAGLLHAALALLGLAMVAWLASRRPRAAAWAAVALLWLQSTAASPFALHPGSRAALAARPPPLSAAPPGPRLAAPLGCDHDAGQGDLDAIDLLNLCERRTGRPSTNAEPGVDSFPTYSALAPGRWERVLRSGPYFWPIARRLSTTHVLSRPPASALEAQVLRAAVSGAGPPALLDGGALLAFEVPHRPWASFAPSARSVPGPDAALPALAGELDAGSATVVVEAGGPLPPLSPGRVLSVDRRPEEVTIVAESSGEALLVVNDAWAAGWRGWLDGGEVEILPADVLARAVRWPAGRHELRMRYRPPGLLLGMGITLATLGAMVVLAATKRRRGAAPGRARLR